MIGRTEEEAKKKQSEKQAPDTGKPNAGTTDRTYTADEVADLMFQIEERRSARARKEPETEAEAEEEPAK